MYRRHCIRWTQRVTVMSLVWTFAYAGWLGFWGWFGQDHPTAYLSAQLSSLYPPYVDWWFFFLYALMITFNVYHGTHVAQLWSATVADMGSVIDQGLLLQPFVGKGHITEWKAMLLALPAVTLRDVQNEDVLVNGLLRGFEQEDETAYGIADRKEIVTNIAFYRSSIGKHTTKWATVNAWKTAALGINAQRIDAFLEASSPETAAKHSEASEQWRLFWQLFAVFHRSHIVVTEKVVDNPIPAAITRFIHLFWILWLAFAGFVDMIVPLTYSNFWNILYYGLFVFMVVAAYEWSTSVVHPLRQPHHTLFALRGHPQENINEMIKRTAERVATAF